MNTFKEVAHWVHEHLFIGLIALIAVAAGIFLVFGSEQTLEEEVVDEKVENPTQENVTQ